MVDSRGMSGGQRSRATGWGPPAGRGRAAREAGARRALEGREEARAAAAAGRQVEAGAAAGGAAVGGRHGEAGAVGARGGAAGAEAVLAVERGRVGPRRAGVVGLEVVLRQRAHLRGRGQPGVQPAPAVRPFALAEVVDGVRARGHAGRAAGRAAGLDGNVRGGGLWGANARGDLAFGQGFGLPGVGWDFSMSA